MSSYPYATGTYATGALALAPLDVLTPVGSTDPVVDVDNAIRQIKLYLHDIKGPEARIQEVEDITSAGGVADLVYPVGTIYETTATAFDPNVSFYGTWVQVSKGMARYGYDAADNDYNATGDSTGTTGAWAGLETAPAATAASDGAHTHSMSGTIDGYILEEADIPAHDHINGSFNKLLLVDGTATNASADSTAGEPRLDASGNGTISSYGGGGSHTHGTTGLTAGSGGAHTHSVTSSDHDNRPPGYITVVWERTV